MNRPKWAQPVFTDEACCSICSHPIIYFELLDSWVEETQGINCTFLINNWAMKRYCQECYYEYGGSKEMYPDG